MKHLSAIEREILENTANEDLMEYLARSDVTPEDYAIFCMTRLQGSLVIDIRKGRATA